MRIFFVLVSFILLSSISAQKTLEGGVLGGGLYYLGDVNPSTHFYNVQPGVGVFFRENLNKRWAIRVNVLAGTLAADDQHSNYSYQQTRAASFNTPVIEINGQAEFNFLAYKLGSERYTSPFTPYFATGMGFVLASNSNQPYNIFIPLSVGFKLSVTSKLEIGVEYSYRKVFSDKLDNLSGQEYNLQTLKVPSKNKYKQNAFYYDQDWYVYTGLFITYKIFQSGSECKAYDY
ncbi:MAG: hypothetical protein JXR60_10880 [Bacteroidales bacterium]|nr:hypothetical protein [Bacteroidales bacterium]